MPQDRQSQIVRNDRIEWPRILMRDGVGGFEKKGNPLINGPWISHPCPPPVVGCNENPALAPNAALFHIPPDGSKGPVRKHKVPNICKLRWDAKSRQSALLAHD